MQDRLEGLEREYEAVLIQLSDPDVVSDQKRLRENMGALKGGVGEQQLLKRYVSQLNQQEDRIAALRRETVDLQQRLSREQAALQALIKALVLDVELTEAASS